MKYLLIDISNVITMREMWFGLWKRIFPSPYIERLQYAIFVKIKIIASVMVLD